MIFGYIDTCSTIKICMNKILEIIQDSKGQFSAMRFVTVLGVALIFGVWATMCFRKWEILDIPQGVVYVFSIVVAGKMGQKFIEDKTGFTPTEAVEQISKLTQTTTESTTETEETK